MTKVLVYLRVSTKDQSTESQMTAIKTYCEQNKITICKVYQDQGISGVKASRPGLDAMTKDIRTNEARSEVAVVVYSFSRFARSTIHLLNTLDEYSSLGVRFISITEQIDSETAHGRMVFSILCAIAELERHLIRERVFSGLSNAVAKGKRLGAPKKVVNTDLLKNLLNQKLPYTKISQLIGLSPSSVCRRAKSFQKQEALLEMK